MKVLKEDGKVPIYYWANEGYEAETVKQAADIASMPHVHKHFALMADGHPGYGMPIGGVCGLIDCISPMFVGKDIGCGMIFLRTNIPAEMVTEKDKESLISLIRLWTPIGQTAHKDPVKWYGFNEYEKPTWLSRKEWNWITRSLGTMGSGNHFNSFVVDETGHICLLLHSGSRSLGEKIADHYHKISVEECRKWYAPLPNDDLAFLPINSIHGKNYYKDMTFALSFARENRRLMMEKMKDAVRAVFNVRMGEVKFGEPINAHHNYAALENHFGKNVWVHRKGAIKVVPGEIGIIPGSMGTNSYIVAGKKSTENTLSFNSASHGAGRTMSRAAFNKTHTKEECEESMKGLAFSGWAKDWKGNTDLSESPLAYKDIEVVMDNQRELVSIVHTLKPFINVGA